MEDVDLIGVSTIGADCYLEPSLSASIKIINRFSNKGIQVAPHTKEVRILSRKNGECMHSLWMHYQF